MADFKAQWTATQRSLFP